MNNDYVGDDGDKTDSLKWNVFYALHVHYSILIKFYNRAPL